MSNDGPDGSGNRRTGGQRARAGMKGTQSLELQACRELQWAAGKETPRLELPACRELQWSQWTGLPRIAVVNRLNRVTPRQNKQNAPKCGGLARTQ